MRQAKQIAKSAMKCLLESLLEKTFSPSILLLGFSIVSYQLHANSYR